MKKIGWILLVVAILAGCGETRHPLLRNRFRMDLYYDGECFIYTDGTSKFIIHPNYQIKVNRETLKLVNFITATRRTDKKEFNGKRYIKI